MPRPASASKKCGICKPEKKWPASRRKKAIVRDAVKEG
jgi:hypothetical protein